MYVACIDVTDFIQHTHEGKTARVPSAKKAVTPAKEEDRTT